MEKPSFDFKPSDLDRRPSWLLNDIHDLMRQRAGENSSLSQGQQTDRMSTRIWKQKRLPNRSDMYKNFQKEKAPPPPTAQVYANRLKKSTVGSGLSSENEAKVNDFLELISNKKKRQKERSENYMHKSLRAPSPTPFPTGKFHSSSRPVLSSLPDKSSLALERPKTAPALDRHSSKRISSMPISGRLQAWGGAPGGGSHIVVDSNAQVYKCFATFVKAAAYCERMRIVLEHTHMITMRRKVCARKIELWFISSRDARRRLFISMMPPIFMRYLRRFQKRNAVKIISTFVKECASMQSSTVVRKFLVCVRKAQKIARSCLAVKTARREALSRLWERVERQYRRQFEEHEKETLQRLQKERMGRLTSGDRSNVHDKWNLTHHQVALK